MHLLTPFRRSGRVLVGVVAAVAIALAGCSGEAPELEVVSPDDSGGYDYDFEIPAGTGARLDDGVEVEIVPQVLDVKVGERIRVTNDDERGAAVGIFWVPAGGRVAMEFTAPGTLSGECDVHPSGEFTINVT